MHHLPRAVYIQGHRYYAAEEGLSRIETDLWR